MVSAWGLSSLLLFGQTAQLLGNPTGGEVVAGSAGITGAGSTLTINQATSTAIINWQQFSINSGELTKFVVPTSSSATLNRVLGGNPSAIYGTLQSNGQLYLINPSGIVVGPNGRIDTAGFLGSTLDVSSDDFLKGGNLHFLGSSDASIDNAGTIHASGGDVYLIANQVNNTGTLSAPQGNVGLAAGTDILFQQAGSQHLFVQPTPSGTKRATGVTNAGTVLAATAELKAAGGNAYALAINNTGHIAATGYKKVNGQVYLTADGGDITNSGDISANNPNGDGGTLVLNGHGASSTGTVLNSGQLVASGQVKGTRGGTVQVLGNRVGITDNGGVDVSGDAGGGTALIGGDEHGANPNIANADQTYLGSNAKITADAKTSGNGGKVILWGNKTTQAYGQISARGGAHGGNGGFVETSAETLQVDSTVDTSAAEGTQGTWLLDPSDVTISDSVSGPGGGFSLSPLFTITSGSATINQATLLANLANNDVTIDASQSSGGGGTITWQQSSGIPTLTISSASGQTLTLNAPTQISLNNVGLIVNGAGGLNLVLNSSSSSGQVTIQNSSLSLNGGNLTAFGTGYVSASDNNGNPDGIDILSSAIDAQGGSISLTGTGGYVFNGGVGPAGGLVSGNGVFIQNGSKNTLITTSGSGDITIQGTYDQNITTYGNQIGWTSGTNGVAILGDSGGFTTTTTISVAQGILGINGTVGQGVSGDGTSPQLGAGFESVDIDGASIEALGTGGTVSITGDTSGTTVFDHATNGSSGNKGIVLGGDNTISANTMISVGTNGILILNGTSGTVDSTFASDFNNTGNATGLDIATGTQITGGGGAILTLTGTGGAAVTNTNNNASPGTSFTGSSDGVKIGDNNGTGGIAQITVGTSGNSGIGGSISINGFGGSMDIQNDAIPTSNQGSSAHGVSVSNGSLVAANDAATISIFGIGGPVTAGANTFGDALGVAISADHNGDQTIVSSESGLIQITGTGGDTTSLGIGVVVNGFRGGTAEVESATGDINIIGTGGNGYTGTGAFTGVTGNYVPNYGVALVNGATLFTGGTGTITLTGTGGGNGSGGSNSFAVAAAQVVGNPFIDTSPTPPTPTITSGGTFSTVALGAGPGVYLNGNITALDTSVTALSGTASNLNFLTTGFGPLSLFGGNYTVQEPGSSSQSLTAVSVNSLILNSSGDNISLGTTSANSLTINGAGNIIQTGSLSAGQLTIGASNSVILTNANNNISQFGSVSSSGAINLNNGGNDIDLGTANATSLTIGNAGNITQAGSLNTGLLTISASKSVMLTNAANNISQLGNVSSNGGIDIFTDPGLTINGTVAGNGPITIQDVGNNLTLGVNALITNTSGDVSLATDHYIINNSSVGSGVIQNSGGNYYLYSSDAPNTVLGGLTPTFVQFSTTYPAGTLPGGNTVFYLTPNATALGPFSPVTTITPPPPTGSNPVLTPPVTTIIPPAPPSLPPEPPAPPTPPGPGSPDPTGGTTLAGSTGNSSTVGSGDAAQLGDGGLDNVSSPAASGALNQALSPEVQGNLTAALNAAGDFGANIDGGAGAGTADNDPNTGGETTITSGGVVEIGSSGVQNIPLNQAPPALQVALGNGVLDGLQPGAGH